MRKLLFFKILICILPFLLQEKAVAAEEQKQLIYFKDKAATPFLLQQPLAFLSPKALERRQKQKIKLTERDLPVNPAYVQKVKDLGISVWYTSRWFNAAVVQCTQEQLAQIEALPFVNTTQNLNRVSLQKQARQEPKQFESTVSAALTEGLTSGDYGFGLQQADMLGVVDLHAAGYNGAGLNIAVFDTGFPGVDTEPAFAHLYQYKRLKGTFDFVNKTEDVYNGNAHGTMVLSTMAAFAPSRLIGTAYGANYYLFRTEDVASEHQIEEINWLLAAEYADSAGVDIINASLGYTAFDAPSQSYTYRHMDGNTALVTRAADFAAATGMLVVTSAGNAGGNVWRYISAPADGDSVLAVGAVNNLGNHAAFSSYGPTADGRIKPDVVALGELAYVLNPAGEISRSNGTSFSSPIMAGMLACLWQANYGKGNMYMLNLVKQMGSNATAPNNTIGYGIPNYLNVAHALPRSPSQEEVLLTNPVPNNEIKLTLGESFRNEAVTVHIFDTSGRLLYRQELEANRFQHVLEPKLPKQGIYLCRVSTGSKATTVRFVKL